MAVIKARSFCFGIGQQTGPNISLINIKGEYSPPLIAADY
ncbi:hypothetical protein ASZ90_019522 [hydrocarbon metagenome]|uniref:Uncharacterized protein n=1 Tax=hydrocarbon metagenome TaxID=938273 RepID=A0A0W8E398_9ZZZZ